MQTQTITQNITIIVGEHSAGALGAPNSGFETATPSPLIPVIIIFAIIATAVAATVVLRLRTGSRHRLQSRRPSFRGFGALAVLGLAAASLAFNLPTVSAAPVLTIDTADTNINVTIPKGGGTATATTDMSVVTANPTGYSLTAALAGEEPGIDVSIHGGSITEATPLTPGAAPTTLTATSTATASGTPDAIQTTLTFDIDGTVGEGEKTLKLHYAAVDNIPTGVDPADPTDPEVPAGPPTTMQSLTTDYCHNQMTIYDGTNPEVLLQLADPRGDNQQNYTVGKLADGNCWMLDNLKLGSTTSPTTLTDADTDLAPGNSLVIPAVTADPPLETPEDELALLDTPFVFGPVPGDTGTGATNYGYLYNWSAATAGESRTTMPGDGTNDDIAPQSICPAGWRLPVTSYLYDEEGTPIDYGGDFAELNRAFGGSLENIAAGLAGWQFDGPFRGVFSGYWGGDFGNQSAAAYLWSASAYPGDSDFAFMAYFDADDVYPVVENYRVGGVGVRCLLR